MGRIAEGVATAAGDCSTAEAVAAALRVKRRVRGEAGTRPMAVAEAPRRDGDVVDAEDGCRRRGSEEASKSAFSLTALVPDLGGKVDGAMGAPEVEVATRPSLPSGPDDPPDRGCSSVRGRACGPPLCSVAARRCGTAPLWVLLSSSPLWCGPAHPAA